MLEIGSRPVIVVSLKEPNISALWLDVNNADEIKLKVFNDTLGAWQEIYSPPYLSIVNRLNILEADVLALQDGVAQIGQDINNINQSIVLIEADVLAAQTDITNINIAIGNINTALDSKMEIVLGAEGELPKFDALGQLQTTNIKSIAVQDSNIHFINRPQLGNTIGVFNREEDKIIIPLTLDTVRGFDPLTYEGLVSFYIGRVKDANPALPSTVNSFGDEAIKFRYQNSLGANVDTTIYLSFNGSRTTNIPATLRDVFGKQVIAYFTSGILRQCILVGVEKGAAIVEEDVPEVVILSTTTSTTYTVDVDTPSYISIATTPELLNGEIILEPLLENKAVTFSVIDDSQSIVIDTYSIGAGDVALAIFDVDEGSWSVNITASAEIINQTISINGEYNAEYAVDVPCTLLPFSGGTYRIQNTQLHSYAPFNTFALIGQVNKAENTIYKIERVLPYDYVIASLLVPDPSQIKAITILNNDLGYNSFYRGVLTNLYFGKSISDTEYMATKKSITLVGTTNGIGTIPIGGTLQLSYDGVFLIKADAVSRGIMGGAASNYTIVGYNTGFIDSNFMFSATGPFGDLELSSTVPIIEGMYYIYNSTLKQISFYYKCAQPTNIGSVITITINSIT